jgi:hypothetical protein
MITALIRTEGSIEALALTLGALVPGVAEGLVADAVVLVRGPREEVSFVAEAVGAKVAVISGPSDWAAGARIARRDWLLCLDAGDMPVEGWIGALERFVLARGAGASIGRLERRRGLSERASTLLEALVGTDRIRPGDLVERSLLRDDGFASRHRPVRVAARIERPAGP